MKRAIKKAASTIANFLPTFISGTELEFFAGSNITNSQLITLMNIFYFKRCTMGQLAESHRVTMPTVTGLIDRLVKLKLVKRSVSEKDRRRVYIELTGKGKNLIYDFQAVVRQKWEKVLDVLAPNEINNFQKIVEKLNQHIQRQKDQG